MLARNQDFMDVLSVHLPHESSKGIAYSHSGWWDAIKPSAEVFRSRGSMKQGIVFANSVTRVDANNYTSRVGCEKKWKLTSGLSNPRQL